MLAILIRAVGERPLVDDPQAEEALGDFVGHHGRSVVGQESTGQTTLLNRLREPVHEVIGGLREVPLDVAAESRMVIEDARRDWAEPLAAGCEHLERAMVEIEMPERPPRTRLRSCGPRAVWRLVSARASPGRGFGSRLGLGSQPCRFMSRRTVAYE